MEKCDFILEFKGIDNYQGEQKEICRSGNAVKWDNLLLGGGLMCIQYKELTIS